MTSWLRGTAYPTPRASLLFLEAPDSASPAAIRRAGGLRRRAVDPLHPAHLDLCLARLRGHVVEQHTCLRLLDVLIDGDPDDDVLMAAEAAADANAIAFADEAVRLGVFVVDDDLAAFARALGLRAGLEQAGDVEPDVNPD